MSATVPHAMPGRAVPATEPAPLTVAEAIARLHASAAHMRSATDKLLELAQLGQQTPEIRPVVINDNNNGLFQVIDRSPWAAKSIGVINPGAAPVYIGIAGMSARPGRVPSCPGTALIVLPVEAEDLELGCDPAVLGNTSAVLFLMRFVTVQPAFIGAMS